MRLDYVLYVVGVICFIVSGVFIADAAGMLGTGFVTIEESMKQMTPIIFFILGIIFAVGGYVLRPRAVFPTITVSTPHEPEQIQLVEEKIEIPATSPVEEAPSPAEVPVPEPKTLNVEQTIPPKAPTVEKPTKVAKEEGRKKPTKRRRRRKKRQKQS
jgi:hypothetical protein